MWWSGRGRAVRQHGQETDGEVSHERNLDGYKRRWRVDILQTIESSSDGKCNGKYRDNSTKKPPPVPFAALLRTRVYRGCRTFGFWIPLQGGLASTERNKS